jgi:NADH:ubiquinone oxidoreductase subunit F (NADH-binding)
MTLVHRVLFPEPITTLDEYLARGGGAGLSSALGRDPQAIISEVEASGLRGRGGAGFPTGRKWRTVCDYHAPEMASTVVVNGAEGEPGTFKDRTILRVTPYAVIEGALIAARAVGADEIMFGLKRTFATEVARLRSALDEVQAAGWTEGLRVGVFEGSNEYLYGEETALLESIEGRYPLPRIAPPYRRGDREVVETDADLGTRSGLSAHVEMAEPGGESPAPPTLVDNVETLANIPRIVARGASWFRTEGTEQSPGTIVCTVIGDVQRAGVGEVIMGTPLRDVIEAISGGPRPGHRIKAVLPGVSNAVIGADQLDAPVSYEGLAGIGSGLGSAGFMVFDETADLAAVAAGVSRFLAVESCGQCTPCKRDGLALAQILDRVCRSEPLPDDLRTVDALVGTVGDRARCYLATQHQVVIGSFMSRFRDELAAHASGRARAAMPYLIAELLDIEGTTAVVDERYRRKQPDWSYDHEWSGKTPADLVADHRRPVELED